MSASIIESLGDDIVADNVDTPADDDYELEALQDFIGSDKVEIVTLSNGRRALKDVSSGEIVFVEGDESDDDEDSSSDDDVDCDDGHDDRRSEIVDVAEDEVIEEVPQKQPLILALHKDQTVKAIHTMILKTTETLGEKKDLISTVRVEIEGYPSVVNPALHRPSKKRYAQACEQGLLGLLHTFGFKEEVMILYAIAYLKTQIKDGQVVAKGLNSQNDQDLFLQRLTSSMQAYQKLVMKK